MRPARIGVFSERPALSAAWMHPEGRLPWARLLEDSGPPKRKARCPSSSAAEFCCAIHCTCENVRRFRNSIRLSVDWWRPCHARPQDLQKHSMQLACQLPTNRDESTRECRTASATCPLDARLSRQGTNDEPRDQSTHHQSQLKSTRLNGGISAPVRVLRPLHL